MPRSQGRDTARSHTQSRGCFSQGKSISDFEASSLGGHIPPQLRGECFSQQAPPAGLGAWLLQVLFWQQQVNKSYIHLMHRVQFFLPLFVHISIHFCSLILSITAAPQQQEQGYKGTTSHSSDGWATAWPPHPSASHILLLLCSTSSSDNPLSASDDKASFFNGCHPPGLLG